MSKDTGGSAFPAPFWSNEKMRYLDEGMTLRDYFAAQALTGIIAGWNVNSPDCTFNPPAFAARAYIVADAMIAERNKP